MEATVSTGMTLAGEGDIYTVIEPSGFEWVVAGFRGVEVVPDYEDDPAYQEYLEEKWEGESKFEAEQEAAQIRYYESCGEPLEF